MAVDRIYSIMGRIKEIQSRFFPVRSRNTSQVKTFKEYLAEAQERIFQKIQEGKKLNLSQEKIKVPSDYDHIIKRVSAKYKIPEKLIKSIIKQESNFNPRAVSKKGAMGLMQLLPSTARMLGVKDIFNPEENIEAGVKYLRNLLDRFNGDLIKALAAYNAGPEVVEKYNRLPDYTETKEYVRNVLRYFSMM